MSLDDLFTEYIYLINNNDKEALRKFIKENLSILKDDFKKFNCEAYYSPVTR